MGSDEAIYSYAVERILETGDWLTPRSIPSDEPFFEKPPLKFWMVAGAIRAGALPLSDGGMRALDAIFGVAAFAYVYLLGVRLAGPVCGVTSALLLFAFGALLFEHGLRSNNMEAALVLAYCGGIFHFVRWTDPDRPRRRREALAVALYFVLGFMTKFVAALFLPMIMAVSVLLHGAGIRMVRQRWRDWVLPPAVVMVLCAPWFIYESLQPEGGRRFWEVLVGVHVYQRLAAVLAPEHLAPWHHYFTSTWHELGGSQIRWLVVAGLGCLAYCAWRPGRERLVQEPSEWLARVVLVWWLLPYTLISFGTSKLLHYAYPFIPPLALAGGLACALGIEATHSRRLAGASARVRGWLSGVLAWAERDGSQRLLLIAGVVLLGLGVWTALRGPVIVEMDGVRVFRNGSVVRPMVFAFLCLALTSWGRRAGITVGLAVLLMLLPVDRYFENVNRIFTVSHPLRAIRHCAIDVRSKSPTVAPGALRASGDVLHHAYFYNMRHVGPWVLADPPANDEAIASALGPQPMPVFVTRDQYEAVMRAGHSGLPGVLVEKDVVALLPGPFERCVAPAEAAGAQPIE
jgi:4-amino-4-deoxy-L-arabinose transferase-like glycosyltransferase